jgi:hypothetical protein
MNQSILRRLKRVEAAQPKARVRFHKIVVGDRSEIKARVASMIAAGEAEEGDKFIVRVIVEPPVWKDT